MYYSDKGCGKKIKQRRGVGVGTARKGFIRKGTLESGPSRIRESALRLSG